MRKYLHIGVNFVGNTASAESLQTVLNNAIDWVRYAPNCWIVLTSSEPAIWYHRLKAALHDSDTFFVCELSVVAGQITSSGFLPGFIWEWFSKHAMTVRSTPVLPAPDSG
jgi:hypothetical protein